jgi:hypothetical protein
MMASDLLVVDVLATRLFAAERLSWRAQQEDADVRHHTEENWR